MKLFAAPERLSGHGIPVLLKDNINTNDMPTTGGSQSLAGYMPTTDAAVTQKLRAAGYDEPGHKKSTWLPRVSLTIESYPEAQLNVPRTECCAAP
jgi:Amidase